MTDERNDRIDEVFQAAVELPPQERPAFVERACASDVELRRAVERLLGFHQRAEAEGFLDGPAAEPTAEFAGPPQDSPFAGQLFGGRYRILAALGSGGMGDVFLAHDEGLDRRVALKLLATEAARDDAQARRFRQEALAASALNHPNIITIHEFGQWEHGRFMATEFIEGSTLRQLISAGLTTAQALDIAVQVTRALGAAHAAGIVHRDIKPDNVMVRPDGLVKVLDFGIAKYGQAVAGPGGVRQSLAKTSAGVIVGTPAYMSPEQAQGRETDARTDAWGFGCVLYEMLAGKAAFRGPTLSATIAAILEREPDWNALPETVPAAVRSLLQRCLAKDPAARLEDLSRARAELEDVVHQAERTATFQTRPPAMGVGRGRSRAFLLGTVLVLVVAAAAWMRVHVPRAAIASLAVLPFGTAGHDADAEYLGEGLTESLIDQMSRVPALKVMARATVFRFKGAADPQEAGRKLGVEAVLTGTVARHGQQLSISAELVEISTGARLWGETYDRPLSDLMRVQDSIASEISDALRLRLSGADRASLGAHGTTNAEAYDLFLRAGHSLRQETEEGELEARRLYAEAVEKDPAFVAARVGLASTYSRAAVDGREPAAEAFAHGQQELEKALALEPGNVAARCALANRHFFFDWDWPRVEREYRELSAEPRLLHTELWRPIALYFWARGLTDQAVALTERALQVDPGDLKTRQMRADFLAQGGRLDQAIGAYRGIVEAEPSDPAPRFGLAEVLRRRGDLAGAIGALRKAYELSGEEEGTKALATAHSENDYDAVQRAVARSRLAAVEASGERDVPPLDLARLHAQVGERDKALASLGNALAVRSPGLVYLKVDTSWDGIRDDPRFASLVRRVGIP